MQVYSRRNFIAYLGGLSLTPFANVLAKPALNDSNRAGINLLGIPQGRKIDIEEFEINDELIRVSSLQVPEIKNLAILRMNISRNKDDFEYKFDKPVYGNENGVLTMEHSGFVFGAVSVERYMQEYFFFRMVEVDTGVELFRSKNGGTTKKLEDDGKRIDNAGVCVGIFSPGIRFHRQLDLKDKVRFGEKPVLYRFETYTFMGKNPGKREVLGSLEFKVDYPKTQ